MKVKVVSTCLNLLRKQKNSTWVYHPRKCCRPGLGNEWIKKGVHVLVRHTRENIKHQAPRVHLTVQKQSVKPENHEERVCCDFDVCGPGFSLCERREVSMEIWVFFWFSLVILAENKLVRWDYGMNLFLRSRIVLVIFWLFCCYLLWMLTLDGESMISMKLIAECAWIWLILTTTRITVYLLSDILVWDCLETSTAALNGVNLWWI